MDSLLIRGGTIIRSSGVERTDVLIRQNVITAIGNHREFPVQDSPSRTIDASGLFLFPGLIDCHVHFREPGYVQKETMASGARAAHAGGVTTVCEMPNTDPPTVTVAALADKIRRSEDVPDCDIRFFFGVTQDVHLQALRDLWTGSAEELARLRARCCGVKIYLEHSTGNQKVPESLIEDVFRTCAEFNIPLVAHCEDAAINHEAAERLGEAGGIASHSARRPPESEAVAISRALAFVQEYRTPFHVAHLSTAQGIELVAHAKIDGLPVTCEVTPHHLLLTTEQYGRFGTFAKMNPPLRDEEHLTALWAGIADGTVDCISTDHAPHTIQEKQSGPPLQAPSGVPGVETMFPLLLTIAHGTQTVSPYRLHLQYQDIVRLCFSNPNRIFRLGKDRIREGCSPDIVIVDPNAEWEIHGERLHGQSKWTPFEGVRVTGVVRHILRASQRYADTAINWR